MPQGKNAPTLVLAAWVNLAIHILEEEGKKKKTNLCLDEECIGAPRKQERWKGHFHVSIAHNTSARLLPSLAPLLLHPFHYS